MKLTILGSGTCVPSIKRSSPSYFLEIDKTKILLDCGPGSLRQIVKAKKDYKNIDAVILSHQHMDHASDLFAFIQALSWTPDLKNKNFLFNRNKNLHIISGQGFKKWFYSIQKITGSELRINTFKIIVKELKNQINFNQIKIQAIRSTHTSNSIFIKFSYKGKSIVYSGDTPYDENICKFAKNADLLVLECAWPNYYDMGHLTPDQCGILAKKANPKKLVLTHFYPPIEKVNIIKNVSKHYKGKIIVAEDLMQITI